MAGNVIAGSVDYIFDRLILDLSSYRPSRIFDDYWRPDPCVECAESEWRDALQLTEVPHDVFCLFNRRAEGWLTRSLGQASGPEWAGKFVFERRYAPRLNGLSDEEVQQLWDEEQVHLRTHFEQKLREAWAVRRDEITRVLETATSPRIAQRAAELKASTAQAEKDTEEENGSHSIR